MSRVVGKPSTGPLVLDLDLDLDQYVVTRCFSGVACAADVDQDALANNETRFA